ncbi:helix-turn-helix domain-containing protein [Sphingobium yanoikuyae]|uniref:helix-turn-helix domain-containing protein n=1 Tax=Sphingobium yanoikuyae TaxID=13690 RepID=UPI00345EBC3D
MESQNINKRSNWLLVDAILGPMNAGDFGAVSNGAFAALADRVRAAIESADPSILGDVTEGTEALVRDMFKAAPAATRKAIQGHGVDPATFAAYLLGQASFAQLLAARVQDRRPSAEFMSTFSDERFSGYLRALLREPMNGTRLQEEIGEQDATVSRKMARLRQLGIVTARKEGTRVVNALTPAARAMADHLKLSPLPEGTALPTKREKLIEGRKENLPAQYHSLLQFGGR